MKDALSDVLEIVIKRHMMLRRTLSNENKINLDKSLIENTQPDINNKTKLTKKLNLILGKEKIAAFQHIKNAYSSISTAFSIQQHFESIIGIEKGVDMGVKVLCGSLSLLYSGDQRFFKEHTKTRPEVAKEGGIARKEHYLATKQKACELLNTLTPQEGWIREFDAFKAILPEVEKYMTANKIKYPALASINRTLRRWVKKDPIVSAAVRIIQPPAHRC